MIFVAKAVDDDIAAIESLLDKQSSEFRKLWNKYLTALKSEESLKIIRDYLEDGRDDLAIQYIQDQTDSNFLPFFLLAYLAGATAEVTLLTASALKHQSKLNRVPKTSFSFDSTDYYVNQQIRYLQTNFKQFLADSQRRLFEAVVREARAQGMNNRKTARYLIDNLGLTEGQYSAILNYEKLLRANSKEALNRSLRDKRYDRTIERAVKNKTPLTEEQIQAMVAAYRRRYIRRRAEEISRNTSKSIIEEGRAEAARQVLAQAGLSQDDMVKEWRSRRDKKVRFTHSDHGGMDGQVVKENEYFISPSGARLKYPHDPSAPLSETSGCRCKLLRYIRPADR